MITSRRVLPAVFLLTTVALLPGIGGQPALTQSDEFRVSMATTLEMHRDGHFWVPHLDGALRLQKPPLLYWLMFLTTSVLGPTLFAARLPIVLFAAGSACLTESLARRTGFDGVSAGSAGSARRSWVGAGSRLAS